MNDLKSQLTDALRDACPPERFAWLERVLAQLATSDDIDNELAKLSAMARRKMGDGQLASDQAAIATPSGDLAMGGWSLADATRATLILQANETARDDGQATIEFLFRRGDETERALIARSLALYDTSVALKPLMLEAGRANSLQLVSAVSLHNPYPAAHYSEREFNQLVLKALFLQLPVEQIVGLQRRANADLSRMCEDYYDERTEAQRDVPADIWLPLGPHASPRGEALMLGHLSHDSSAHRCYAAKALSHRLADHPQLRDALLRQAKKETDAAVLSTLQAALTD